MKNVCPHCQGTGYTETRMPMHIKFEGEIFNGFQARILKCLIDAKGESVSRDKLFGHVYTDNWHDIPASKSVEVIISRMRRRLWSVGYNIKGYWGGNYRLVRHEVRSQ